MTSLYLPPFLLRAAIRGLAKRQSRRRMKWKAISRNYDQLTAIQIAVLALCLLLGGPCLVIAILYLQIHPLYILNIGWPLFIGFLPGKLRIYLSTP